MPSRPYIVEQGDHLPKLAARYGFEADVVWNDPENDALRKSRKDPNMLYPGDVLYIPEEKKGWLPVTIGSANTFTAAVPTVGVSASFLWKGEPLANATCEVHGVRGLSQGTTDGNGKLALKVPTTVQFVTVKFPDIRLVRRICVGHLDPIDTPSGVLERLRNLRFIHSRTTVSAQDADALARYVKAFQVANKLTASGECDSDTLDALTKAHGC